MKTPRVTPEAVWAEFRRHERAARITWSVLLASVLGCMFDWGGYGHQIGVWCVFVLFSWAMEVVVAITIFVLFVRMDGNGGARSEGPQDTA